MKPFKMQNVKPMKFIGYKPTLAQLKRRAKKYGMTIRKYKRGEDSYLLVDVYTNAVAAPEPMTLAEIERELDDFDAQQEIFDREQEIFEQAKDRANETGEPQVIRYSQDHPPVTVYPDDAEPF